MFKNTNRTLKNTDYIYQANYGEYIECEIKFDPIDIQDNKLMILSSNLEKFELTFRNNRFMYKKGPIYSTNLIKEKIKIAREPFEDKIISNYFFGEIKIDTSYLNENDEYACCLEEVANDHNKKCSYLKFNNNSVNHFLLNSMNIDIEEINQNFKSFYISKSSIFHNDYLKPIIVLCLFILILIASFVLAYIIKSYKNNRSRFQQQPNLFTISQKNNQNVEYPHPNLISNLYSRYNLNNPRDFKVNIDECPPSYNEIHDKENNGHLIY
jgi:hypothetical protein